MPQGNPVDLFFESLSHNIKQPLALLLVQMIVILFVSRVFNMLFRKIGQPGVVGEILAGIALGPSILGHWFPQVSGMLFPVESLPYLKILSQFGLILFMFVIGMELDMDMLRQSAVSAVVVSHISIAISFTAGIALSGFLYVQYMPQSVPYMSFALFMGVAMSIAAFPVLARIIQERGLSKSPFGKFVIASAAIDDFTAWCLLALIIAVVKAGSFTSAIFTVALSVLYVSLMLFVLRPFLMKASSIYMSKENISKTVVAFIFIILLISAYATEVIGIHALFGSFMAGLIMPQHTTFKAIITEKIEDVSLVLLLPLFFVFTGLRTQIGLLNEASLWFSCLLIIAVATVAKGGSSILGGRLVGRPWKESLMLGALMNTRGLMELVVLNIGFDLGVLSDKIFAMMVIMAIATTFSTGPYLSFIEFIYNRKSRRSKHENVFRILMSFGPPIMGEKLLKIAGLIKENHSQTEFSALHITPQSDISRNEAYSFEKEAFEPLLDYAKSMGYKVKTMYKANDLVTREIIQSVKVRHASMLLMGGARSLFDSNILGGVIRQVSDEVECPMGIFLDRGFEQAERICFIVRNENDPILQLFNITSRKHTCQIIEIESQMRQSFDDLPYDLIIADVNTWLMHLSTVTAFEQVSLLLVRI